MVKMRKKSSLLETVRAELDWEIGGTEKAFKLLSPDRPLISDEFSGAGFPQARFRVELHGGPRLIGGQRARPQTRVVVRAAGLQALQPRPCDITISVGDLTKTEMGQVPKPPGDPPADQPPPRGRDRRGSRARAMGRMREPSFDSVEFEYQEFERNRQAEEAQAQAPAQAAPAETAGAAAAVDKPEEPCENRGWQVAFEWPYFGEWDTILQSYVAASSAARRRALGGLGPATRRRIGMPLDEEEEEKEAQINIRVKVALTFLPPPEPDEEECVLPRIFGAKKDGEGKKEEDEAKAKLKWTIVGTRESFVATKPGDVFCSKVFKVKGDPGGAQCMLELWPSRGVPEQRRRGSQRSEPTLSGRLSVLGLHKRRATELRLNFGDYVCDISKTLPDRDGNTAVDLTDVAALDQLVWTDKGLAVTASLAYPLVDVPDKPKDAPPNKDSEDKGDKEGKDAESKGSKASSGEAKAEFHWVIKHSMRTFCLADEKTVFKSEWQDVVGDDKGTPKCRLEVWPSSKGGKVKGADPTHLSYALRVEGMDPAKPRKCDLDVKFGISNRSASQTLPDSDGKGLILKEHTKTLKNITWYKEGLDITVSFSYPLEEERKRPKSPEAKKDRSSSKGRRRSVSKGRGRSDSKGRDRKRTKSRRRSISKTRRRSTSKGPRRSKSKSRRRSVSKGRRRSVSKGRRRSKSGGRRRSVSKGRRRSRSWSRKGGRRRRSFSSSSSRSSSRRRSSSPERRRQRKSSISRRRSKSRPRCASSTRRPKARPATPPRRRSNSRARKSRSKSPADKAGKPFAFKAHYGTREFLEDRAEGRGGRGGRGRGRGGEGGGSTERGPPRRGARGGRGRGGPGGRGGGRGRPRRGGSQEGRRF